MNGKADYGKSGDVYVPYKDRTGAESMVFFTRDLSAEGLERIYKRISCAMTGRVAVKLYC